MNRPLWSIPVLLFFASIAAPDAHADTLVNATLDFTLSHGGPTPSGSFVFDFTKDEFTSFLVNWDGNVYDFSSEDNADNYYSFLPISGQEWCAVGKSLNSFCGGNDALFLSFGTAFEMGASVPFATDKADSDEANGTYSVTCRSVTGSPITCPAAPTPEPGYTAILLVGLAAVIFVARRRSATTA
jgi:hypothetical protein